MAEPIRLEMLGDQETKAGNYFVSNYPPYSFWKQEAVQDVLDVIERKPATGTPLGIYTHIPFCRKRCHFCYFRVYTDKDSSEIRSYLDALLKELTVYASKPYVASGKYIQRMSNYCTGCRFNPANATGADACPFTTLYWDFLQRNEKLLAKNQRMVMQLKNLTRLSVTQREAIRSQAAKLREKLK